MKGKMTKKYGVLANALYMLRMAKDTVPSVIVLTVLQAIWRGTINGRWMCGYIVRTI